MSLLHIFPHKAQQAVSYVVSINDYYIADIIHINADDTLLSTSGYNHDICVYDTSTAQIVTTYQDAHDDDINISRFSNQSPNIFLTCSCDKTAKLWDMRMPPHQAIYTVTTPTRLTTIAFHPNDIYFLTSGVDNHVHQFLTLDGRLHQQYKLPQIHSDINFSRSYYTSSGAYVVSGGSEEEFVSICDVNTGDLIRRIRLYPGRSHDSLYVQVSYYELLLFITDNAEFTWRTDK